MLNVVWISGFCNLPDKEMLKKMKKKTGRVCKNQKYEYNKSSFN